MTGRPDYDVGDLVAAVRIEGGKRKQFLPVGSVWVVLRIWASRSSESGWLVSIKDSPDIGREGWATNRFRKVDPLPKELTQLLASKPVREKEPA